jgi:hypothetical protein
MCQPFVSKRRQTQRELKVSSYKSFAVFSRFNHDVTLQLNKT